MGRKLGLSLSASAVLVAALIAGVGCGSSTPTAALTFTKKTTTTVANPDAGTPVRCGKLHAKIPPPGENIAIAGKGSSSSAKLQISHETDTSLIISCKP